MVCIRGELFELKENSVDFVLAWVLGSLFCLELLYTIIIILLLSIMFAWAFEALDYVLDKKKLDNNLSSSR